MFERSTGTSATLLVCVCVCACVCVCVELNYVRVVLSFFFTCPISPQLSSSPENPIIFLVIVCGVAGRRNMARVGSRYYKAPELLVGFRFYDYAVDIFS